MGTYDKYDPVGGGFRAPLAANWTAADGVPLGVGLNTSGRVVPGAGNAGVAGIVILKKIHKNAGDVVDVMKFGEVVDIADADVAGRTAGTSVYADDVTGALGVTGGAGKSKVGFLIENDRLFVSVA